MEILPYFGKWKSSFDRMCAYLLIKSSHVDNIDLSIASGQCLLAERRHAIYCLAAIIALVLPLNPVGVLLPKWIKFPTLKRSWGCYRKEIFF